MTSSPPCGFIHLWIAARWSQPFLPVAPSAVLGHTLETSAADLRAKSSAQRRNAGSAERNAEGNNGCGLQIYYFKRRLEELRLVVVDALGCVELMDLSLCCWESHANDMTHEQNLHKVHVTKNPHLPQCSDPKQ